MLAHTVVLFAIVLVIASAQPNLRPIIGIVTEPTDGALSKFGDSFISAGYVKFVEMGGARVVPIPYPLVVPYFR